MSDLLKRLRRSERAASAVEFALVLPLLLLLLFGIIDAGRFMWEVNQAEKATQVGARMAIVTDPVSPGLIDADFASATVPTGELIPADSLGELTCTSTTCTCVESGASTCPAMAASVDSVAFTKIVTRMSKIYPRVDASNVEIIYRGSGFGYAGNPIPAGGGGGGGGAVETMEISPLVTVQLSGVAFQPITTLLFTTITMPTFTTTLTSEDASGQYSN